MNPGSWSAVGVLGIIAATVFYELALPIPGTMFGECVMYKGQLACSGIPDNVFYGMMAVIVVVLTGFGMLGMKLSKRIQPRTA